MKDDTCAHLHDILQAAGAVKSFVTGKSFIDYSSEELLRSGVERKLEIMGEALNRIKRDEPELLASIRDYRDVISFRNILVHGYDAIDNRIVWGIVAEDLDNLIADIERLLHSATLAPTA